MALIAQGGLGRNLEIAQRALALIGAVVIASCSSAGTANHSPSEAAWPMYRGDLERDGHPTGATLDVAGALRLSLAWRAHLDGAVDGTPAVAGGLVFAGSANGELGGFNSQTGATVWLRRGLGAISDSPAVDRDRVFVGTLTGHVRALRAADGNPLWDWKGPANAAFWASPVVFRDLVLVGVASPYGDQPLVPGRLVGLDAETGRERWNTCLLPRCQAGDGLWSTPAIDAYGVGFVGVGNPDDAVLAFDALTGARKWLTTLYPDRERDLDVGASPVVFKLNGREVAAQAGVEGTFALLDAATGERVWSRKLVEGSAVHGLIASPAFDGTALYVASASPPNGLLALSPTDGMVAWRHATGRPVYSAPAAGNGVVVFGTGAVFGDLTSGSLIALATTDGRELWKYDTHSAVRSGPAIAGGLVLAGDYSGDVLAFRTS